MMWHPAGLDGHGRNRSLFSVIIILNYSIPVFLSIDYNGSYDSV